MTQSVPVVEGRDKRGKSTQAQNVLGSPSIKGTNGLNFDRKQVLGGVEKRSPKVNENYFVKKRFKSDKGLPLDGK